MRQAWSVYERAAPVKNGTGIFLTCAMLQSEAPSV